MVIAIGHIFGLLWADKMFKVTGIGKEMSELAQINTSLPYLLTIFVTIVFFTFGLYGLSADNKFRKLPFIKPIIFLIAVIYLLPGLAELIADKIEGTNSTTETIYSSIALIIGLLFLICGFKKWKLTTGRKTTNR